MPKVTAHDRALLVQMERCEPDLRRWNIRGREIEKPDPGSELHSDDTVFPEYPISEVVRQSLLAAGEHLRLAWTAVTAGQLYPSAHFTVLRGALVGAAQGVWIAGPSKASCRQQRGLTVVAEIYAHMTAYNREMDLVAPDPGREAEVVEGRAFLAGRVEGLKAVRTSQGRLLLTDMIRAAAHDTFDDVERRQNIMELWRRLSGDAHVLTWPAFTRGAFGPADRRTGLATLDSVASLDPLAEAYIGIWRMLRHGWSLYDGRCEAP